MLGRTETDRRSSLSQGEGRGGEDGYLDNTFSMDRETRVEPGTGGRGVEGGEEGAGGAQSLEVGRLVEVLQPDLGISMEVADLRRGVEERAFSCSSGTTGGQAAEGGPESGQLDGDDSGGDRLGWKGGSAGRLGSNGVSSFPRLHLVEMALLSEGLRWGCQVPE